MMNHFELRRNVAIAGLLATALIAAAQQVRADSPDAWEEYANDVQQACLNAALGSIAVTTIQVDPFGSESFGYALIVGFQAGTTTQGLVVCAYDKASQRAEISAVFE